MNKDMHVLLNLAILKRAATYFFLFRLVYILSMPSNNNLFYEWNPVVKSIFHRNSCEGNKNVRNSFLVASI